MATGSNQLLDNIMKSLEQYSKQGIHISPYLSAIQSTKGQTPGEKYKNLNYTVKSIIAQNKLTKHNFSMSELDKEIPEALEPLVKIRIGHILRSNEAVIEALKSEDIPVTNQAFKAKWFFHSSNPIISADYFAANVFPYVSKCVRFRIIKALSQSLLDAESKAEDFFNTFADLFGAQEVTPLLPACSEMFIEKTIPKHQITLSYKTLVVLYKRHPDLVIRILKKFLRLQTEKETNRSHIVTKKTFNNFLPRLIRHHPQEFIDLCSSIYDKKIGSTCAKLFLKHNLEFLIKKPKPYIDILPLRIVSNKLTLEQFDEMFKNLLPYKISDFQLYNILFYLKYYPKDKRDNLLKNAFKLKYSIDFLDADFEATTNDIELIYGKISMNLFEELFIKYSDLDARGCVILNYMNFSQERKFDLLSRLYKYHYKNDVMEIFNDDFRRFGISIDERQMIMKLLPYDKREDIASKKIRNCEMKSKQYYEWYVYMRSEKSFPIFKDAIAKSSEESYRSWLLTLLVKSCAVDNKKEDMLAFLEYYNNRHKNENPTVLENVLVEITIEWDSKLLDMSHCIILTEIFQRAFTKNELKTFNMGFPEITDYLIHYLIADLQKNCENKEKNDIYLDILFSLIIDSNRALDYFGYDYTIGKYGTKEEKLKEEFVQKYCLEKILTLVESRFSKTKRQQKVINTQETYSLVNRTLDLIQKYVSHKSIDKSNKRKIPLQDYPYYLEMLNDFLTSDHDAHERCEIFDRLKKLEPNFSTVLDLHITRDDFIDDKIIEENIRSGSAMNKLRKSEVGVLKIIDNYVRSCTGLLRCNTRRGGLAAKRFFILSKWHQDMPARIIENCLENLEDTSNWKVLGVMLEGGVFSKLVTTLIPEKASINVEGDDAKQYYDLIRSSLAAMNLTYPPVSFDVVVSFFKGDYTRLAVQVLGRCYERVAQYKLGDLAEQLNNKPVSVKKHGIRLYLQITSKPEQEALVRSLWQKESNQSIREMIATELHTRLAQAPSGHNWKIMEICIDGLTVKDELALAVVCNVGPIKSKYINHYIKKLICKIEELREKYQKEAAIYEEYKDLEYVRAIESVLSSVTEEAVPFLTEDFVISVVEKYCFIEPSESTISLLKEAENFAKKICKRPFSTNYYKLSFATNQ